MTASNIGIAGRRLVPIPFYYGAVAAEATVYPMGGASNLEFPIFKGFRAEQLDICLVTDGAGAGTTADVTLSKTTNAAVVFTIADMDIETAGSVLGQDNVPASEALANFADTDGIIISVALTGITTALTSLYGILWVSMPD